MTAARAELAVDRSSRGAPNGAWREWLAIARAGHAIRCCAGSASRPGFTPPCSLTLALGIGANAAIFSVSTRCCFEPLPFAQPRATRAPLGDIRRHDRQAIRSVVPDYVDLARENRAFATSPDSRRTAY